jgi:hypothetical protein
LQANPITRLRPEHGAVDGGTGWIEAYAEPPSSPRVTNDDPLPKCFVTPKGDVLDAKVLSVTVRYAPADPEGPPLL